MVNLPTKTLGKTGLEVTALGYGAMGLRRDRPGQSISDKQAKLILETVLDSGINFIDTSIDYGQSEETIGTHIANRRSEFFLASKCGCLALEPPGNDSPLAPYVFNNRGPHLYTAKNILAGVEQSLQRLKTDYLDLVQVHMTPSRVELERFDAVEGLLRVKEQGKVRFIGMSGVLPNLSDHLNMELFDVFQIPYSLLQRDHEEIISEAAAAGAGIIVRGGAARGIPSDTKQEGETWNIWQRANLDELLNGISRMEFTLRFTLSHVNIHTNIVGTTNIDHFEENIRAILKGPLPQDMVLEAQTRLSQAGSAPALR